MIEQPGFQFARDYFDVAVPSVASHASRQAAERLQARGVVSHRLRRILDALAVRDMNDSELKAATGLERHSICSARAAAVKRGYVFGRGEREGSCPGFQQTVWAMSDQGRAARG